MKNITNKIRIGSLILLCKLFIINLSLAQCPESSSPIDNPNPANPAKDIIMNLGFSFLSGGSPVACAIAANQEDASITVTWNGENFPYTKSGGGINNGGECGVTYIYNAADPSAPADPPEDIELPYSAAYSTTTCEYTALGILLPVEIVRFDVSTKEKKVYFDWSTTAEINNNYFEILRSHDGKEWEAITTINGAGTTSLPVSYQYIDRNPLEGNNYYMLSQTDFDGTTKMLGVHFVEIESDKMTFQLFPNPTSQELNIQVSETANFPLTIRVFDVTGKQVEAFIMEDSKQKIDVNSYEKGFYFLQINDGRRVTTEQFLKQ